MAQRSKRLNKKVFSAKEVIESAGWKEDRYGHFQKTKNDRVYRLKIQHHTIRYEVKGLHNAWILVKTLLVKDVTPEAIQALSQ